MTITMIGGEFLVGSSTSGIYLVHISCNFFPMGVSPRKTEKGEFVFFGPAVIPTVGPNGIEHVSDAMTILDIFVNPLQS